MELFRELTENCGIEAGSYLVLPSYFYPLFCIFGEILSNSTARKKRLTWAPLLENLDVTNNKQVLHPRYSSSLPPSPPYNYSITT